ncbi:MAG: alpha-E domain-containing protein [Hyphomicrobiaceae bacterium]|nr:alpha-E domain-containing protein [Hyphomicrobiaceae bacterium]
MSLLARYAEHLFWLARYTERASSLSRIIETHAAYDRGREAETSWAWLVKLYADDALFAARNEEASARNVLHFYIRDLNHPGSILSTIRFARENARTLRAVLPTEMWVHINEFYNRLMVMGEREIEPINLSRTCGTIRAGANAQLGIATSTLYRDEGWRFYELGAMIERADQTSRLLDVKFAQLATMSGASEERDLTDTSHWALVLRSAAAYQAFHRHEACRIEPNRIAAFLTINASHPRAAAYCVLEMERVVNELRRRYKLGRTSRALERLDELHGALAEFESRSDLVGVLHQFNDGLQRRLNALSEEIGTAFFGHGETTPVVPSIPAEAASPAAPKSTQAAADQAAAPAPAETKPPRPKARQKS